MRAIRVKEFGGPEVLTLEEIPLPSPGPGQVLVKVEAAGLNYIDVYHRTGLYPNALPFTPGVEGAGTVAAVGPSVTGLDVGDSVAWASAMGSYADQVLAPAAQLIRLPEGLDTRSAAAVMLQGMTAHYLTGSTYPLKPGDTCLVHAAAGGVGLLLVQMAKERGARVIGTVSTEEKAALAREAGADEVIRYTQQDFLAEVKRLTNGRGLNVVYDSVGQTTFEKSLDCLSARGMLVLYGQSSGPVAPFSPGLLSQKGSLFLTRPTIAHYVADRPSLEARASSVLGAVASGRLKVRIDRTFPLAQAAEAHRTLEGRKTTGKVLLLPS
ncbi:MAG TPA: quinone oxidoreductase [Vicinamibacteria bacterium]|jgi:NADPH2:quinone reductase|nr:quinone oxidoreductase [Vicinamibacteria bacterium]